MLHTLNTYSTLKSAEIPEKQARAITTVVEQAESEITQDLNVSFVREISQLRREIYEIFATKRELADTKVEIIRWMFIFWAGNVIATAGLLLGAVKMLR